tara:strand:+ start:1886 stop:2230 length:345 start_codon:yes stop_codon:yes gene_type:complete
MRVRISYGVEIENVPSTVSDLLWDSIESLEKTVESLKKVIEDLEDIERNGERVSESIDKCRQDLSKIDLTASDCQSIITGLVNYYNGEEDVSDRRPVVDPGGNIANETTSTGEG